MIDDVKTFLSNLGYDLVGFGFVSNTKNAELDENGEYPADENDRYIVSYLASELNSYSFETRGTWMKLITGPISRTLIDALGLASTEKSGMIRFDGINADSFGVSGLLSPKVTGEITYDTSTYGVTKVKGYNSDLEKIWEWTLGGIIDYASEGIEKFEKWLFGIEDKTDKLKFTIEIKGEDDNTNPTMTVKSTGILDGNFGFEERSYDLTEWLEQFGMPTYFLLTLHCGTMIPDFAYGVANYIQPKVTFKIRTSQVTTSMVVETETEIETEDETLIIDYVIAMPYISKVRTWYGVFDYSNALTTQEESIGPYTYTGADETLKGAEITDVIHQGLSLNMAEVKRRDNTIVFRALMNLDAEAIEKYIEENSSEIDAEEKKVYNNLIKYINKIKSEGGYKKYTGTVDEDGNGEYTYVQNVSPTSSMRSALEMIDNVGTAGSETISRELKKILAAENFVIHDTSYPTTLQDAYIDTFDFILPNYYPSVWPCSEEIGDECVYINYSSDETVQSFKVGEKVIMPADGKIIDKTNNSITIVFTEQNCYNYTMIISGISPESDIEKNDDGIIERGTVIAKTTDSNIKLVLKNNKDKILLASDYMDGVYLREDSIIASGKVYPVFKQTQEPWGSITYYREEKYSEADEETSFTYAEIGGGNTVLAMAISGLTGKSVTPDEINLRINEIGTVSDKKDQNDKLMSEINEDTGFTRFYETYVTSKGMNPKILESDIETTTHPTTGESVTYTTATNEFLDAYNIKTHELDKDEIRQNPEELKTKALSQGYPVIVCYTDTKEIKEEDGSIANHSYTRYVLILSSANEEYDCYVMDPENVNNNGQYKFSSQNFKDIVDLNASDVRIFVLGYFN